MSLGVTLIVLLTNKMQNRFRQVTRVMGLITECVEKTVTLWGTTFAFLQEGMSLSFGALVHYSIGPMIYTSL